MAAASNWVDARTFVSISFIDAQYLVNNGPFWARNSIFLVGLIQCNKGRIRTESIFSRLKGNSIRNFWNFLFEWRPCHRRCSSLNKRPNFLFTWFLSLVSLGSQFSWHWKPQMQQDELPVAVRSEQPATGAALLCGKVGARLDDFLVSQSHVCSPAYIA